VDLVPGEWAELDTYPIAVQLTFAYAFGSPFSFLGAAFKSSHQPGSPLR